MALVEYANSLVSNIFRICAFLFLRVVRSPSCAPDKMAYPSQIPARLGKTVLPALYTAYITTWLLLPSPAKFEVKVEEVVGTEKAKLNGTPELHDTRPTAITVEVRNGTGHEISLFTRLLR
jgi:hypothetical protein